MNIFQRIKNAFKTKSITMFGNTYGGITNFYDSTGLGSFRESLYLFIGVSMIRETVSGIPLLMYRIKNKDGEVEEIFEDPLLDLIKRPNDKQTQKEFWKLSISYYLLAGEAFWYLERDYEHQVPTAMVNMRPDNVEIILDENSNVIAYEFRQGNGELIKIPAFRVLHIKNIDPVNPLRGIGVISPAKQRIVTEKEASQYQSFTFKNYGRPDVAVFTNVDLTQEAGEEARKRWDHIYGREGGANAGFFGSQITDIKLLNTSPKEMEFMNTQKFVRDDILAVLKIPKAMITSDDVNLANSKVARINYLKEAVEPVLDTFIDIINNKLCVDLKNDIFITYDSEVTEDREILLKEAVSLFNAQIIKLNEARELMNYEIVESGDEFKARSDNLGIFEIKSLRKKAKDILKSRPMLVKKFEAIEAVSNLIDSQVTYNEVRREQNSLVTTKEAKDFYIKKYNENIDNKTGAFKKELDKYIKDLSTRTIELYKEYGMDGIETPDELSTAKKFMIPVMIKIYEKAGNDALDLVSKVAEKDIGGFVLIERLVREIEERAEFFLEYVLNTTFKQLKTVISEGMTQGHGVDKIARSMREYFDDMTVSRSKTIARTETGRLVSKATNDSYEGNEVITGKVWLTAGDDKVRDIAGTVNDHTINDEVVVGKNDTFPNGERYPAELTINCRCALAPAV